MVWTKAYIDEDNKYKNLQEEKITHAHAKMIVKKVSRHFKLGISSVHFRGQVDRGHAYKFWNYIQISWNPSLLVVAHEINHFLVWKKYPKKKVNHGSKKWAMNLERIIKYCGKKNWWREEQENHEKQEDKKIDIKRFEEQYKKLPEYSMEQLLKSIKQWESKRKRAENTLKKLYRRKKFLEKKL